MVGDISAILLRCIGEHQRSFGDASPRHQWKLEGGRGAGGGRRGGGGGVDLYKFLSWFMSVIFFILFYVHVSFTRVRAFLLSFTLCTVYWTHGILHYKQFLLLSLSLLLLKAKIFALGEWYSCRRLAFVSNSGISTLGFNSSSRSSIYHCAKKPLSTR